MSYSKCIEKPRVKDTGTELIEVNKTDKPLLEFIYQSGGSYKQYDNKVGCVS